MVRHTPLGVPIRISCNVPKTAHMTNLILRSAVVQVQRVPVRSRGLAAVGKVGLLVDMETMLGARLAEVLDVPGDGDGVGVGLLKGYDTGARFLRFSSIARLAIGSDNTSGFDRKGGHDFIVS